MKGWELEWTNPKSSTETCTNCTIKTYIPYKPVVKNVKFLNTQQLLKCILRSIPMLGGRLIQHLCVGALWMVLNLQIYARLSPFVVGRAWEHCYNTLRRWWHCTVYEQSQCKHLITCHISYKKFPTLNSVWLQEGSIVLQWFRRSWSCWGVHWEPLR